MRRLLRAAAGLLLLVLLVPAAFLTRAHLQVRGVAPPLPGRAQLTAALAAGPGPVRLRYVNTATQGPVGHPGFLLEWADGRSLLIDAGMDRESAREFGELIQRMLGGEPIAPHGPLPEQMGAAAARIDAVVFTHLHADHTAGLLSLCAARQGPLPVLQTPPQVEELNFWTRRGDAHLQASACAQRRRLGPDPLEPLPGFPGVAAYTAGGHTPGSTVFAARLPDGIRVFSGDITNFRESLLEDRAKPRVYSWLIVPEATGRLAALRAWLRELDAQPDWTVIVSHDLAALEALGVERWPGASAVP